MKAEQIIFKLHKALIKTYVRSLIHYDLVMEENLPAGPKLLVANHPTTSDPFFMPLLVKEPISLFVTGMAFEVPVFGKVLTKAGHIPVNKSLRSRLQTVDEALERLAAGRSVGLFPEGSLSPERGEFCRPRSGAARIALQSGVPVIPIGIYHSKNACFYKTVKTENYERTGRLVVRGDYFLSVGKPIVFSGDTNDDLDIQKTSLEIMAAIIQQTRISQKRMNSPQIRWQPLFARLAKNENL